MEDSILKTVKKILGLSDTYTAFDLDVIIHINTIFSILNQLGVGPDAGFSIEDDSALWADFIEADTNLYSLVKSYMALRVRILFDPPATSFVIDATNTQIQELEWRINAIREKILADALAAEV